MEDLDERELHMIEDQLNREIVLIQKCKAFAAATTDPQIKAKCEQLAGAHKIHCERMLRCLD